MFVLPICKSIKCFCTIITIGLITEIYWNIQFVDGVYTDKM